MTKTASKRVSAAQPVNPANVNTASTEEIARAVTAITQLIWTKNRSSKNSRSSRSIMNSRNYKKNRILTWTSTRIKISLQGWKTMNLWTRFSKNRWTLQIGRTKSLRTKVKEEKAIGVTAGRGAGEEEKTDTGLPDPNLDRTEDIIQKSTAEVRRARITIIGAEASPAKTWTTARKEELW